MNAAPRAGLQRSPGRPRLWTDERIAAELRRLADELGHYPSQNELGRRGHQGLAKAITRRGGAHYWASRLGHKPHPRFHRPWTEAAIAAQLEAFLGDRPRTRFPTALEFEAAGLARLRDALHHHGGTTYWAERFGFPPLVWTEGRIERELRAFAGNRDALPLMAEFNAAGLARLWAAMRSHGGVAYWCQRIGLPTPQSGPRRRC